MEPVETIEVGGGEVAPEGSAPAVTDTPSAPLSDWNGELASLDGADWYQAIPDDVRNRVRSGLEAKYRNLEAGYTRKSQELAETRQQWEARKAREEKLVGIYSRIVNGDEGYLQQVIQQAQEAEALREEAVKTAQAEVEAKYAEEIRKYREAGGDPAAQQAATERMAALQKQYQEAQDALGALKQERDTLVQAQEAAEREVVKAILSNAVPSDADRAWLEANEEKVVALYALAPDDVASDPYTLVKWAAQTALTVRDGGKAGGGEAGTTNAAPAPDAPDEPGPEIDLMSTTSLGDQGIQGQPGKPKTLRETMERLYEQAEAFDKAHANDPPMPADWFGAYGRR